MRGAEGTDELARLWAANIRAEGAELVSREQTQLLLINLDGRLRAADGEPRMFARLSVLAGCAAQGRAGSGFEARFGRFQAVVCVRMLELRSTGVPRVWVAVALAVVMCAACVHP